MSTAPRNPGVGKGNSKGVHCSPPEREEEILIWEEYVGMSKLCPTCFRPVSHSLLDYSILLTYKCVGGHTWSEVDYD